MTTLHKKGSAQLPEHQRQQESRDRGHCRSQSTKMGVAKSTKMTSSTRVRQFRHPTRMLMRDWLLHQAASGDVPGLEWLDAGKTLIRIPWIHASKAIWSRASHCRLFENWAIYTGKYRPDHDRPNPKRWKANFRCALNSLPDVKEEPAMSSMNGEHGFKIYRFTSIRPQKLKREEDSRGRTIRSSQDTDSEHSNRLDGPKKCDVTTPPRSPASQPELTDYNCDTTTPSFCVKSERTAENPGIPCVRNLITDFHCDIQNEVVVSTTHEHNDAGDRTGHASPNTARENDGKCDVKLENERHILTNFNGSEERKISSSKRKSKSVGPNHTAPVVNHHIDHSYVSQL